MANKSVGGIIKLGRRTMRIVNGIAPMSATGCFHMPRCFNSGMTFSDTIKNVRQRNVGLSLGQPTSESHAEFYRNPMEVIPGVFKEELRSRRQTLCHIVSEILGKKAHQGSEISHLVVVPASPKRYMTENIPYPYRQNSNFFYLSGSYDPEAFIVLCITPKEQLHALFLNDPDPMAELWDGPKTTPKAAVEHYGFDQAYLASDFDRFMHEFAKKANQKVKVWCEERSIVEKYLSPSFGLEFKNTKSPKAIIDTLRIVKSPAEIELMRQSAYIASKAFQQTIKFCAESCSQGLPINERQIWAKLDYECRLHGADRLAYPPVVAAGSRANIIHYVFNSNQCNPNDMILVDAGCEFFGYCSDITRTWPVAGKFNNEHHRALYEMVLKLQTDLIKHVQPGISLDELFRIMSEYLIKGLEELGIIHKGTFDARSSSKGHEIALRFCPHHVSHYLGMDVHDTSTIERNEPLVPGMIVTVEPGIYLRKTASNQDAFLTKVGKEFTGLAIRIEDDVLVTPDGSSVLTSDCPKTIEDIENWGRV